MKHLTSLPCLVAGLAWLGAQSPAAYAESGRPASEPIPLSELGAHAGAQYHGDGLAVFLTPDGLVRLRCAFQRLEGQVTRAGLWLSSTVPNQPQDQFRVAADYLGRDQGAMIALPEVGVAKLAAGLGCYDRPGLTEEYSVSVDGVRQDFVVAEAPRGTGALRVEMNITGARVEKADGSVRLTLEKSGRKLAYSRLRVVDAAQKELDARFEIVSPNRLAVVVEDKGAAYPVRIDPTFSDANWVSLGGLPGADGVVFAAVVDGSGNLYVGGQFSAIGSVVANRVAKWNGSSWSALGSGLDNNVLALAVSGTDVYVGGNFTFATNTGPSAVNVNRIAKWNGTSWSALGSGMDVGVSALAVSAAGDVYAGGFFSTAGGVSAVRIAKWDASSITPSWSALGTGLNSPPLALAVSSLGEVYAGGSFTTAGGVSALNIAKWNGSIWSAVGLGLNGSVNALAASSSGQVYAGGTFTFATNAGPSAISANRIARWDGTSWSALGTGMNSTVRALAVSALGEVYAGGSFTTAGGVSANYIAKWGVVLPPNPPSWSPLGSGTLIDVNALALSGGNVYAGGFFTTAGGAPAKYVAKWSGSAWSPLAPALTGPDNWVQALAVSGTDVYAGGYFTSAGGVSANYIAKWNGSAWSPLGSGMNSYVWALALSGTTLYAGGYFTTAGGVSARSIAKWDITAGTWSPIGAPGAGMDGPVLALAVLGPFVCAGGNFNTVLGVSNTRCIAKWNTVWSGIGLGVNAPVNALAVSGTVLYAGGDFTFVTNTGPIGVSANRIAKWDGIGNTWAVLGSGMNATVSALAVAGPSDLYAGGGFTLAGGVSANRIAKWNGGWSPVGTGMNGQVNALAVSSAGDVYAGGLFITAGGVSARNIAKWNGAFWSPLGSGTDGPGNTGQVNALAVSGSDLYAGGFFMSAGDKGSAFAARALLLGLVATNTSYARAPGLSLKIRITDIAWDVNGNPVTMSSLGASAQGATLSYDSSYIYYQPANHNTDTFTYTVSNGSGTATGNLTVTVAPSTGIVKTITVSGGTATIKLFGIPGQQYDLYRTTSLTEPVTWTLLNGTPLAPGADGSFSFTDLSAPNGTAYYHSVQH